MLIAVLLVKRVQGIIGVSVVDARRQCAERLVAEGRGVQQGCDECAGSLGPVVVAPVAATASGDVDECSRR